ncbi:hypothetical protein MAR_003619 [Mya arenaria]|uniref:Uncharacterized protein n=1 Tax=Mya arenaria TaxID=6604 RepID=A0ABY7GAC5_MYAAR|nr:hypothetical protein MAR_003619 [Mya arenaria]
MVSGQTGVNGLHVTSHAIKENTHAQEHVPTRNQRITAVTVSALPMNINVVTANHVLMASGLHGNNGRHVRSRVGLVLHHVTENATIPRHLY